VNPSQNNAANNSTLEVPSAHQTGNFITDDGNLKYFTDYLLNVVVTRDFNN